MASTRRADADSPSVVTWEVTRACDLVCTHCRETAQAKRSSLELSTFEGYELIEQVSRLEPELMTFSGGDPLKRSDIFELLEFAARRAIATALATGATPLLHERAIERLRMTGLSRLALALDGPTPEVHDAVRGVRGSFGESVRAIRLAVASGVSVEIGTMVSRFNLPHIAAMMHLLEDLGVDWWNLHFYVPGGAGSREDMIGAQETERLFAILYERGKELPFGIRTTEAAHFRRYVLQREMRDNPDLARRVFERGINYGAFVASLRADETGGLSLGLLGGTCDARRTIFVSHIGEVYPSPYLPFSGGNIRFRKLDQIFRRSAPFMTIRDCDALTGKCGACEFREICGGSRARAWAVDGDPMAPEPLCAYQPVILREDAYTGH